MLTNDMNRLCNEILDLRNKRDVLVSELVRGGKDRRHSVLELCGHFTSARAGMARRTKADRLTFLHNLKRAVSAQRRDMRTDLAGVRKAWAGRAG